MHDESGVAARSPERRRWPVLFVVAAGLVVVTSALATVLVDVHDIDGLRTALEGGSLETPYLYFHLYVDGGPIELLQWSCLAALIVTAGIHCGARRGIDAAAVRFWFLAAVLFALMLMEDGGNVRHSLADLGVHVLPWSGATSRTLIEVAFYALVGTPAVLAAWTYRSVPAQHRPPLGLAAGGFVAYVLASVTSASRVLGDWYIAAGSWVQRNLIGALPPLPDGYWGLEDGADATAFMVMDHIYEESVELLGASLLLAAALAVTFPAIRGREHVGTGP